VSVVRRRLIYATSSFSLIYLSMGIDSVPDLCCTRTCSGDSSIYFGATTKQKKRSWLCVVLLQLLSLIASTFLELVYLCQMPIHKNIRFSLLSM
jgi:hypothetical protein